jgi:dienelactone hydrolase
MNRLFIYLLVSLIYGNAAFAQQTNKVIARIPPDGILVSDNDRGELAAGLQQLGKAIDDLKQRHDIFITRLLPDVLIYYKAVDYALKYNEIFAAKEIISAKNLLKEGLARAQSLSEKKAPWTTQKGEVVRGYISEIDGSVQPYGVSVPENYSADGPAFSLSLWFHGRGETMSEVNFMNNGKGFFPAMPAMKNTIMLYPYGRYCNAFKFAGEVDVIEAMRDVEKNYKINDKHLFDRGFSMGGAAAWQFAVHYTDLWVAANPGAGFAETVDFMKVFGKEDLHPTWYERKLWHLYDCTDYASNLSNLPLYAYNGDKDVQKQAADVMENAMKKEGLTLNRIWGLNMGHGYTKAAAKTVDSLLALVPPKGNDPFPPEVHLTTYTLKYNQLYWLGIDAMGEHWSKARVDGIAKRDLLSLKTINVTALTVVPFGIAGSHPQTIKINNTAVKLTPYDKTHVLQFHLENGQWIKGPAKEALAKKHNLQGPVDDAFMSAFIVVKPSGNSKNALFDEWSKSEMDRFIIQWRRQFRGDPIVKMDNEIAPADMASNLILFGDAESNSIIAKINSKLPIKWNAASIEAGKSTYSSKDHGLIMIYPNPLNQKKYIALNSGFTFREESFLNNSKQIPMLPDWAVIDLNTPPDAVHPGRIENAGFFGEHWQWKDPVKE